MRRIDQGKIEAVWHQLEKNKVFNIEDLTSLLTCSVPNARLKLKQWQAYTSYNQNGRYYTLPQVPRFNDDGLWRYKNIAFSRHGNLKKTVIHLVKTSSAGFSGKQLGEILGLSPRSFLHHFRNCPGIHREKHDGVFIYFSDIEQVYEKQLQERKSLADQSVIVTLSDPEAILILVAIIREHGISAEEIAVLPEVKKSKIKLSTIQSFMAYHGLLKKMPDSRL
ncbi:MAG TPA: hypothetical protein VJ946_14820 [Bacteroidales bacterium]|nr:hypothetical protein [Bacteroidales bacterium]